MELNKAIEKIEHFRTLNYKGWNGYDALPISEIVINKALNLIKQLNPTPFVAPTGRNSIQFEWEKDDESLYLEMEIYGDKIEIFNQAEFKNKTISIGGN